MANTFQIDPAEQELLRSLPGGKPVMYQEWHDLLFLHFTANPDEIQPLLPAGLSLDLHPDASGKPMAWIGVVLFWMSGVRPTWSPSVPGVSKFPEFNVRTYVHREGKEPGVWFFSLDAANWLACKIARLTYALPYWYARMSTERTLDRLEYQSIRLEGSSAICKATATAAGKPYFAQPGTLEYFLVERYLLYSARGGELFTGRVWHTPYPLRTATVESCEQTLTDASGIPGKPFIHTAFSDGVEVKVYKIEKVAG
ncbi:MAG: DUF2071 domain-containing protein [Armatimonadetes bacterium]|nr:DUF2071 domain-containing protein [Armatimonadota bacterium]